MIRKYNDLDFNEVYKITLNSWKGELELDNQLESFIYQFLPKYHILNKELSFVDYSLQVDAFMFAALKNDENDSMMWFHNNLVNLSKANQAIAIDYLHYLEYNHQKVVNHMNDRDIYLALIASQKRNSGKILLERLEKIAEVNCAHIYLWTDETCNYQYYEKQGFKLVEEYHAVLQNKSIKTFIYKK